MKVSREQMRANRLRILDVAGRLFREKGFDGVGVKEVMQAAGLTHGGFYGHFDTKDDLIAQTLAHIFASEAALAGPVDLNAYLDGYLSSPHRRRVAEGCPIAALAADVRRQTPEARQAMTEGLRTQIDHVARAFADRASPADQSPESRRCALGVWSTMVGAMVLSRAMEDPALAEEILTEARAWIGDRTSGEPDGALPRPQPVN